MYILHILIFYNICYIHIFPKFNLHFYHTSYIVGALPPMTYSIFIIALYSRYCYYPTSTYFTNEEFEAERLSNLIKFTQLILGSRPRIQTQAVDCKVHVLNPYAMHCLKKHEFL